MLTCYSKDAGNLSSSTPIHPLQPSQLAAWLALQPEPVQRWVRANKFSAEAGSLCLIPNEAGGLAAVLLGVSSLEDFWIYGSLPLLLPEGDYRLESSELSAEQVLRILMAWGLGCYQFALYRKFTPVQATLAIPDFCDANSLESLVSSIYLLRDLINTPTEDMGPAELTKVVEQVAGEFGARVKCTLGDALLEENYPLIHAVGRASSAAPRLIDLRWGDASHPRVTLVGKGVCYDTGGLSIKSNSGMLLMKKDMGGAAHALALARLIMANKLPVCLRLLIPAVENSISANSIRPGDVVVARNGLSVEITNTDAEGRLVLADALVEASSENPELIIDFATLTGAARAALGPDLPALFSNSDSMAEALLSAGEEVHDLMWRLPLYESYRETYLHSTIADITNSSGKSYAGAILAALFLQLFVDPKSEWVHFDIFAFNEISLPGRPQGGEACALRACFAYLKKRYS